MKKIKEKNEKEIKEKDENQKEMLTLEQVSVDSIIRLLS